MAESASLLPTSKVHDGCYIFSDIEEYSFNYSLGAVNLIGKGINLDVEKGCATYNNFMKSNKLELYFFKL